MFIQQYKKDLEQKQPEQQFQQRQHDLELLFTLRSRVIILLSAKGWMVIELLSSHSFYCLDLIVAISYL